VQRAIVDDFSGAVPPKTGGQMVAALDYNGYHRTNTSVFPVMMLWSLGVQGDGLYKTIAQVRTAIGKEQHGLSVDNVAINPFFVNEAAGDYTLKSDSVAIGAGTPLPVAVANAIGVPAGVPVNMGALKWWGAQCRTTERSYLIREYACEILLHNIPLRIQNLLDCIGNSQLEIGPQTPRFITYIGDAVWKAQEGALLLVHNLKMDWHHRPQVGIEPSTRFRHRGTCGQDEQ
jgi:hypothetical protein